jgi:hypothetical protein
MGCNSNTNIPNQDTDDITLERPNKIISKNTKNALSPDLSEKAEQEFPSVEEMQTAIFGVMLQLELYEINILTEEQFYKDGWYREKPYMGWVYIIEWRKLPNINKVEEIHIGTSAAIGLNKKYLPFPYDQKQEIQFNNWRKFEGEVNFKEPEVAGFPSEEICTLVFRDGILEKKVWNEKYKKIMVEFLNNLNK